MRRAAATFILLLIGILPWLPLILQAQAQASLPACCRAHGKHHCMMVRMALGKDAQRPSMLQRCPCPCVHHVAAAGTVFLLAITNDVTSETDVPLQAHLPHSDIGPQRAMLLSSRGPPEGPI